MQMYIELVVFDHLMLQVPPSTPAQFCYYGVAFAQHIDVEIDVLARLFSR